MSENGLAGTSVFLSVSLSSLQWAYTYGRVAYCLHFICDAVHIRHKISGLVYNRTAAALIQDMHVL